MTGGLNKYWGEKGVPCIGHRLAFCSLLTLMFLCPYVHEMHWLVVSLYFFFRQFPTHTSALSSLLFGIGKH